MHNTLSITHYETWLRASMGRKGSAIKFGDSNQEHDDSSNNQRSQKVNNGGTLA